jgi:hypothetical protein
MSKIAGMVRRCMKNTPDTPGKYMTRKAIAQRWDVDRTTVSRTMGRYGIEGFKLGSAKSASVRFLKTDVAKVESLRHPRQHVSQTQGAV